MKPGVEYFLWVKYYDQNSLERKLYHSNIIATKGEIEMLFPKVIDKERKIQRS